METKNWKIILEFVPYALGGKDSRQRDTSNHGCTGELYFLWEVLQNHNRLSFHIPCNARFWKMSLCCVHHADLAPPIREWAIKFMRNLIRTLNSAFDGFIACRIGYLCRVSPDSLSGTPLTGDHLSIHRRTCPWRSCVLWPGNPPFPWSLYVNQTYVGLEQVSPFPSQKLLFVFTAGALKPLLRVNRKSDSREKGQFGRFFFQNFQYKLTFGAAKKEVQ